MADLFTGKYAAFIGPAYAITAATLAAMIWTSLAYSRRWRKRTEALNAAQRTGQETEA
ncbi:heme exporter protein CcmD [Phenylobacterium aquaticum]|uniref:heme exporter protein CcmD n=1 Tax=Phenylobacterium aquaticum TaxID=1763816 RepID=UPI0026EBAA4D|nr:heme exporter protein CcmD [Phenylobacterium aquaticum]